MTSFYLNAQPVCISPEDCLTLRDNLAYSTTSLESIIPILHKYSAFGTVVDDLTFNSIVQHPAIKVQYLVFQSMFEQGSMEGKVFLNGQWLVRSN